MEDAVIERNGYSIMENPNAMGVGDRWIVAVFEEDQQGRKTVVTVAVGHSKESLRSWALKVLKDRLWIGGNEPPDQYVPLAGY